MKLGYTTFFAVAFVATNAFGQPAAERPKPPSEMKLLEEAVRANTEAVKANTTEIGRLHADIAALSSHVQTLGGEIGRLKGDIDGLKTNIGALGTSVGNFNTTATALSGEVARVANAIIELKNIKQIKSSIVVKQAKIPLVSCPTGGLIPGSANVGCSTESVGSWFCQTKMGYGHAYAIDVENTVVSNTSTTLLHAVACHD